MEHEQRALVAPGYPQAFRKVGDVYPALHLAVLTAVVDGREKQTKKYGEGQNTDEKT